MTQYLGICMVVIVVTMCIGILSTIVTENIFKQIENHRKRSWDRWWTGCGKFISKLRETYKDDIDKILEKSNMKNMKAMKETVNMYDEIIDKVHKNGMKIEDIDP